MIHDRFNRRQLITGAAAIGLSAIPAMASAQAEPGVTSASQAATDLSKLEMAGDYASLYQKLHPDAQAIIPFAAVDGWYRNVFAANPPQAPITASGTRDVNSWTWPVNGRSYRVMEVDFSQPLTSGTTRDTVRLNPRGGGVFAWFFGRDAAFVNDQINAYAPDYPPVTSGSLAYVTQLDSQVPFGLGKVTTPALDASIFDHILPDRLAGMSLQRGWAPGSFYDFTVDVRTWAYRASGSGAGEPDVWIEDSAMPASMSVAQAIDVAKQATGFNLVLAQSGGPVRSVLGMIHQFSDLSQQRAVLVWGAGGSERIFTIRAKQLVDLQLTAAAIRSALSSR